MKCDFCGRECKNKQALSTHRYRAHKMTRKEKKNWRRKISEKMRDPTMRKKISKKIKKVWKDPEHRENISKALKGNEPWNKGVSLSKKTRERISKAMSRIPKDDWPSKRPEVRKKISRKMKGRLEGSKNPHWKGGSSFEFYGKDFDELLKEKVRERDQRRCQLCMKDENELARKLSIHHIDGNKKNNSLDNLISFCNSCHSKLERQEVRKRNV